MKISFKNFCKTRLWNLNRLALALILGMLLPGFLNMYKTAPLSKGLLAMFIGIGIVYLFLTLLVLSLFERLKWKINL